jgi:hypothetical protein
MQLDRRLPAKMIRHFSTKMADVPDHVRVSLEALLRNDQSDDFYMGLLAGMVAASALKKHNRDQYVPLVIAFLCEKLEQKEII